MFPTAESLIDQNAMHPRCRFCFKEIGTTVTSSQLGKLTLSLLLLSLLLSLPALINSTYTDTH